MLILIFLYICLFAAKKGKFFNLPSYEISSFAKSVKFVDSVQRGGDDIIKLFASSLQILQLFNCFFFKTEDENIIVSHAVDQPAAAELAIVLNVFSAVPFGKSDDDSAGIVSVSIFVDKA